MEGIVWLVLALVVSLVSLGGVLAGMRRRRPAPHENPGHCSRCETPMSLRRVPLLKSHALFGEWVCPHCGSRIRSGKGVSGTAV
jgi:DNA-directed RNA polymerase subunit RPC12/RpoP